MLYTCVCVYFVIVSYVLVLLLVCLLISAHRVTTVLPARIANFLPGCEFAAQNCHVSHVRAGKIVTP